MKLLFLHHPPCYCSFSLSFTFTEHETIIFDATIDAYGNQFGAVVYEMSTHSLVTYEIFSLDKLGVGAGTASCFKSVVNRFEDPVIDIWQNVF